MYFCFYNGKHLNSRCTLETHLNRRCTVSLLNGFEFWIVRSIDGLQKGKTDKLTEGCIAAIYCSYERWCQWLSVFVLSGYLLVVDDMGAREIPELVRK
jgi:hypothetical protein